MKQTEAVALLHIGFIYLFWTTPPFPPSRPKSANASAAACGNANEVFSFSRCEWIPGHPRPPVVMAIRANSGKE